MKTRESGGEGGSDAFDMFMPSKVLRMLWRHKLLAVCIIMMGLTVSALYTASLPVLYRSTASLLIENFNPNVLTGEMQTPNIDYEIGGAYKVLAESRPVTIQARELCAEPDGGAFEARVQSQLLFLSVTDSIPGRAAKLANAWQRAFSDEMVRRSQIPALTAREFLDKSVPELRGSWIKKQEELNKFGMDTHFDSLEFEHHPVRRRLEDLNGRMDEITLKLNGLEAEKRLLENHDVTTIDLLQLPRAKTDELLQMYVHQIESRRVRLLELKEKYRADSDEIRVVEEAIASLLKDVRKEADGLVRRITFEYEQLKDEGERLQAQVKHAQDEFNELKLRAATYKLLSSEVNMAEKLYSDLATKRSENEVISRYTLTTARPWESAEEAQAPYSPSWRKNMMSGLLLSLLVATISAFILELVDDTVKTSRSLEKKLGVATLGMIPSAPATMGDADGYVLVQRQTRSAIADNFRNIHIALEVTHGSQTRGKAFVITITSAGPNEGKSFVSSNLATLFSSLGRKVLLVDADFRKCSLSKAFNYKPKIGLMDIVAEGKWSPDLAIHNEAGGFSFLPAPTTGVEDKIESFDPKAFSRALELMQKDFDVIIFDTPPVLAMADASAIARVSDVTILVVRSRKTRMRDVERAAANVYGSNTKEVAFLVNFVDPADFDAEAYGYGVGYGYGYSAAASAAASGQRNKVMVEDGGAGT
jgi:succinoglycan biosynthesis transport protein ExoP